MSIKKLQGPTLNDTLCSHFSSSSSPILGCFMTQVQMQQDRKFSISYAVHTEFYKNQSADAYDDTVVPNRIWRQDNTHLANTRNAVLVMTGCHTRNVLRTHLRLCEAFCLFKTTYNLLIAYNYNRGWQQTDKNCHLTTRLKQWLNVW
jgi:hypothetical protein